MVFRSCPSRVERSGRHQLLRGLQILSFAGRAERQASAAPWSSDPVHRGLSGAAGISCSVVFRSCPSRVERSGRHQLLRGLQILSFAGRAERQASAAPWSSDPVPRGLSGAAGISCSVVFRSCPSLGLSGAAGISCSVVFRSCPSRVERSGRHQLLRGLQILSLAG